jgi:hypothetical protein
MGPLLTLIVFKPGKKSLKFDLSVIAMFQIAALAYGSYTIYQERPLSALLVNNSFEIQTASSYNLEEVDPEIVDVDFLSSPKFHVLVPTPEIKIAMMVHAITGEGETDYIQDTKLYSGIIDQKQRISEAALTSVYLDKIYSDLKADVDNYLYVRVIGKSGFGLVQIDKSNFEVIDVVELTDFDMQAL